MITTGRARKSFAATSILFSLFSIFASTNASLSQACTHPDKSPIDWRPKANESRIFQVGHDPDNPREIRVHIPPNYNGSNVMLPVILAFHDKDMSTGEMEYESRLSDPVANENFIVVYPTARNNEWQSDISVRRWQKKENTPKKNITNDVSFVTELLNDIESIVCFDDQKIHAVGMGTGAGMVHLLACDPQLSTRLASFATVAGGYGHPSKGAHWKKCTPARIPIPIMSIHGDDDKVLPYLLNEWEAAKSRLAVPSWLEDWSDRNGCGEPISEPQDATDGTGTAVKVTRLEGGGWISEGEAFNGGTYRIAKSCPKPKPEVANEEKEEKVDIPLSVKPKDGEDGETEDSEPEKKEQKILLTSNPGDFTILHYRVRNFGHGWPTLQIKGTKAGKKASQLFDATVLILDWFKIHELPIEWAGEIPKKEDLNKEKKETKPEEAKEKKEEEVKVEAGETKEVKEEDKKGEQAEKNEEANDHDEL